jgi:hypothetical protein
LKTGLTGFAPTLAAALAILLPKSLPFDADVDDGAVGPFFLASFDFRRFSSNRFCFFSALLYFRLPVLPGFMLPVKIFVFLVT